MQVVSFEIRQVELPFRMAFRHARKARRTSASLFVRCTLANGTVGYGEALPRPYVTGETAAGSFDLLAGLILPFLLGRDFTDFASVENFCEALYPALAAQVPGLPRHFGAACCAAELSLLDAFGHHFNRSLHTGAADGLRCSGVISSGSPLSVLGLALRYRSAGLPSVKLKVGTSCDRLNARLCRLALGRRVGLRADANAVWTPALAARIIPPLRHAGIEWIEQPLPAADLDAMARLHRETGARLIADESLRDMRDAEAIAAAGACQAFNIRISKCGGFFQSLRIARLARERGIALQVGCQVGESAILAAAGLALARRLQPLLCFEGCFGTWLLREDVTPRPFRFGPGGVPPEPIAASGLGIEVDPRVLERHTLRKLSIRALAPRPSTPIGIHNRI